MQVIRDPAVRARIETAFDLYEAAEQIMRQNLRRRFPDASSQEIEGRLVQWLQNGQDRESRPGNVPPKMPATRLQRILRRLAKDLNYLGYSWALVGGFAVAVRTEPQTTRCEVDLAIAVKTEAETERVIALLGRRGYQSFASMDHIQSDRLEGFRLLSPGESTEGYELNLQFHSTGIEAEIVAEAEPVEVLPDLEVPVAQTGHLIALKLLVFQSDHPGDRPHDLHDARALIAVADESELDRARRSIDLISQRGFTRGRDLERTLDQLLARRNDPIE